MLCLYLQLQREELENFKIDINEQLRKKKPRQNMIKTRQEMIFTKQDQIQFTLHGETRPFQSPPLLASPPMTSPYGSLTGSESIPRPLTYNASSIADVSDYSSAVNEYDDSLFNLDWLVPLVQEEKNVPQDSLIATESIKDVQEQPPPQHS